MLTNKWIQFALSLVIAVVGFLATVNWTSLVDAKTGGTIMLVIGIIKMILNGLQPSSDKTLVPTGKSIITHTTG